MTDPMTGTTTDALTSALRVRLRSRDPLGLPPGGREALLAGMTALHDEALAAMVADGVPPDVAEASLADIPRKAELYGELVDDDWLVQVFCGHVLTLGRLQFERHAGAHGRNIHIPETGALETAAVDASLAWAARYFADGAPFVCESWIFDPALAALPAGSNLRAFADRFEVRAEPRTEQGARSVAKFVFRSTPERVAVSPLRAGASSVERIAHAALAGDGLWAEPTGVLRSGA